jgi:uncharacterized protein YbaP (TraB family)
MIQYKTGNRFKYYSAFIVLFCLMFSVSLIISCSSVQERTNEVTKSFLWEVESKTSRCYILGSLHLATKEIYPLAQTIEESFENADVLVVEIDITAVNSQEIYKKTMYPPGETLKMHISKELYELTSTTLENMGLSIELIKLFKPWAVAMTIEVFQLSKMGYDPEYGIDRYFIKKAKGKKEIKELESLEFQVNLFDSFSDELQGQFLHATILELQNSEEEIGKIVESWKTGNIDAMKSLIFQSMETNNELLPVFDTLLHERNRNMVEKIEGYLSTEKIHFVIVGAAHLIGELGIIQRLEEKGYSSVQL